ncbi:MAG: orotidine-5'-phosphate decarboxylase [Candidatus Binatia bacterium]|nr:orotidine-5'-phosphate decarboxylase [Candidatus Binatia bacterium]
MKKVSSTRPSPLERARERLIFPLDVPSTAEAEELIDALCGEVGIFKVGKQLFLHAGPNIVRHLRERGQNVFLDLKFHDIPRTVARASLEATRLGVKMFTLHASGSFEMMRMTAQQVHQTCRREGLERPTILAVTVLTSLSGEDLKMVGVRSGVMPQVTRLAKLAQEAGMNGVVASPLEIEAIRRECGKRLTIVTPGIRPLDSDAEDQKRVTTPGDAIRSGSDYLVVGSPIRNADDPIVAAREIVEEIADAMRRGRARR